MRNADGFALLEVLVALTLLVTAGAGIVALASQATDGLRRARDSEAELRRADAFLEVVALWPREDLDRHLGDRRQGPWRLRITRVAPTLYQATLTDTLGLELLRTAFYRPEASDAPR